MGGHSPLGKEGVEGGVGLLLGQISGGSEYHNAEREDGQYKDQQYKDQQDNGGFHFVAASTLYHRNDDTEIPQRHMT